MIDHIKSDTLMDIPIRYLCNYFGVTTSGYYFWKSKIYQEPTGKKPTIFREIQKSFTGSNNTYGSPRVFQDLKKNNIHVSQNTVAKYMKELGLDARLKRKYKVHTTDSKHSFPIASRIFRAEFEEDMPTEPGKILAGDITYIKVNGVFYYLAVVLDLFNREVIGWSLGDNMQTELILRAMDTAFKKVGPDAQIIFHSDRGSQYASEAYRNFLKNRDIIPSMSRKGNCYDNCYVESWFASLKKDLIYRKKILNKIHLREEIFDYIEIWYNKKRQHSSLGYLSPMEYKFKTVSL